VVASRAQAKHPAAHSVSQTTSMFDGGSAFDGGSMFDGG